MANISVNGIIIEPKLMKKVWSNRIFLNFDTKYLYNPLKTAT